MAYTNKGIPQMDRGPDPPLGGSIKNDLEAAFSLINAEGSFAFQGALKRMDPDLFVHGVGPVALPLSEPQARQLIAKSHLAAYGKGSETIVDTAVRNTWEINPEQFQIRFPRWEGFLKGLLGCIGKGLGISAPISAELYKMLLYEKGAMFKAHTE